MLAKIQKLFINFINPRLRNYDRPFLLAVLISIFTLVLCVFMLGREMAKKDEIVNTVVTYPQVAGPVGAGNEGPVGLFHRMTLAARTEGTDDDDAPRTEIELCIVSSYRLLPSLLHGGMEQCILPHGLRMGHVMMPMETPRWPNVGPTFHFVPIGDEGGRAVDYCPEAKHGPEHVENADFNIPIHRGCSSLRHNDQGDCWTTVTEAEDNERYMNGENGRDYLDCLPLDICGPNFAGQKRPHTEGNSDMNHCGHMTQQPVLISYKLRTTTRQIIKKTFTEAVGTALAWSAYIEIVITLIIILVLQAIRIIKPVGSQSLWSVANEDEKPPPQARQADVDAMKTEISNLKHQMFEANKSSTICRVVPTPR